MTVARGRLKGKGNVECCGRGDDDNMAAAFPSSFEIFHGANTERRRDLLATISAKIKRQDVAYAQGAQVFDMALANRTATDN
jgi:hypothetical protein